VSERCLHMRQRPDQLQRRLRQPEHR
jgi:hypothetical protein